jgi:hypothetical protein
MGVARAGKALKFPPPGARPTALASLPIGKDRRSAAFFQDLVFGRAERRAFAEPACRSAGVG